MKKICPPFTPKIANEADTKYVDKEFTDMTPIDSYADESLKSSEDKYFKSNYNI